MVRLLDTEQHSDQLKGSRSTRRQRQSASLSDEAASPTPVRPTPVFSSGEPAFDEISATTGPLRQYDPPHEGGEARQIEIQLDRWITAGRMANRRDLVMSGHVTADASVEAISLVQDDEVRAVALYPPATGMEQVFRLTLARPDTPGMDSGSFEVVARSRSGREGRVAFVIATDDDDPRSAHVSHGPTCALQLEQKDTTPLLLYVETAAIDLAGVLRVSGWCIAKKPLVAVQVFTGEQRVGLARLGLARDDIAGAYSAYPNAHTSGFALTEPLKETQDLTTVRIEAVDFSGCAIRVVVPVETTVARPGETPPAAAPLPVPRAEPARDARRAIFLHYDKAILTDSGELLVSGWAVCATGIAAVSISVDGDVQGEAELGLPRADVAAEYPAIPQAHHSGFLFSRSQVALQSGERQITISARNGLDDRRSTTISVTTTPTPLTAAAEPPPDIASPQEFRLEIDNPAIIDGAASHPVVGRLVIEGWALARTGVDAIEIVLDGEHLGQAYFGTARRDVEAAFPDWPDALRSGYIFHFPPKALERGKHAVSLQLKARNGDTFSTEFQIEVAAAQDAEDYATIRHRMLPAEADLFTDIVDRLESRPAFRIVVPTLGDLSREKIQRTLDSLREQIYRNWQVFVAADAADSSVVLESADQAGIRDRLVLLSVGTADDMLLGACSGGSCLTGVLMPGDELGCDALVEFAIARGLHQNVQLFYADEDRVSPANGLREPFFKPAWSPDLLLSTNYIGRPWFAASNLLRAAGVTIESLLAPRGDYDALLRCTEIGSDIHHLAKLLCRRESAETAHDEAERKVLTAAAARRGIGGEPHAGCIPGTWRFKRTTTLRGKVSIIVPTCASKGYVATCLRTLRANTAYANYEIICIDNVPDDLPEWKALIREGADKVVEIPGTFNWSRFNNQAVEQSEGEYLLFLNDDVEVQRPDWLDAMIEHAQRSEIGVVGAQLLYPDRKVQHAGIFLTTLGAGRHSFRFMEEDDPGYFGLALTQRNVIAVTGACMLVRRDVFERIGRFDEAHEVINNDVDLCLRSWQAGLSVVYTPYAQLIHHELASRAKIKDIYDAGHFATKWRDVYESGDPYFSPRLTKFADEYRPDTEPARLISAGSGLFRAADIQRILAVKLDHIGDLVTALPALRRLRQHFPAARIHLLASAVAKTFLAGEGIVDEFIAFDFFHARSGLGQKGVTEEGLQELAATLTPYRFDLAVDLRKQIETRHVLQRIPALFRAGYNHAGQFPWLDVALEWEGDVQLRRKHSHISDDLVRLVDAIAEAAAPDRLGLTQAAIDKGPAPAVPKAVEALCGKPVVAVHPGVGAIMRQWPSSYFASLIDLLIEKNGVNVVLVGGHDEVELADNVLAEVVNRSSVTSLAGKTSLSELTGLLRACALYVGNNSGPKHIAAALGVPTVGIHSGIVDAAEWGPVAKRAIAVQRQMVCSPCYLVRPEDCVRDMACLKRLEPAVVHQYCEMMLARPVSSRTNASPRAEDPMVSKSCVTVSPEASSGRVSKRVRRKSASQAAASSRVKHKASRS